MDVLEHKYITSLIRPQIGSRRASLKLDVGVDDLIQETLLKGLKRGLNTVAESEWRWMAEEVLKDALRKQRRQREAESGYTDRGEGSSDQLWDKLEEILEGRTWEEQRIVRLLRAGHTLAEVSSACGLSPWQIRKRLTTLKNSVN